MALQRTRPCSIPPAPPFPVALGMAIAVTWQHRALWGNPAPLPSVGGHGLTSAGGCAPPCRKQASGPAAARLAVWRAIRPLLLPDPLGGCAAHPAPANRPAGALVSNPALLLGLRRLFWACWGAGRRCERLS